MSERDVMSGDKFEALVKGWELIVSYITSTKSCSQGLINWVERHTIASMLSEEWDSYAWRTRDVLLVHVKTLIRVLPPGVPARRSAEILLRLAQDPWGPDVLRDLLAGQRHALDDQVVEYMAHEEEAVLRARLLVLCEMCRSDMALRLAAACLQCAPFTQACPALLHDMADAHTAILLAQRRDKDVFAAFKTMTLYEGLHLVKRLMQKSNTTTQLWKWMSDLTVVAFQFFLTTSLERPLRESAPVIKDFVVIWVELCKSNEKQRARNLADDVRRLIGVARTSEHIYLLGQELLKQFGSAIRPLCIELYIRGVTSQISDLESFKKENNPAMIQEMELRLSNAFLQLASIFQSEVFVWRECILTAFSLNPTSELLDQVQVAAEESSKHPNHHSTVELRFARVSITDVYVKVGDSGVADVLLDPRSVINETDLNLPSKTCDDLASVLRCLRYQTLFWSLKWGELKYRCLTYMSCIKKERSAPKELRYLRIDFDSIRDLSSDGVKAYYGISDNTDIVEMSADGACPEDTGRSDCETCLERDIDLDIADEENRNDTFEAYPSGTDMVEVYSCASESILVHVSESRTDDTQSNEPLYEVHDTEEMLPDAFDLPISGVNENKTISRKCVQKTKRGPKKATSLVKNNRKTARKRLDMNKVSECNDRQLSEKFHELCLSDETDLRMTERSNRFPRSAKKPRCYSEMDDLTIRPRRRRKTEVQKVLMKNNTTQTPVEHVGSVKERRASLADETNPPSIPPDNVMLNSNVQESHVNHTPEQNDDPCLNWLLDNVDLASFMPSPIACMEENIQVSSMFPNEIEQAMQYLEQECPSLEDITPDNLITAEIPGTSKEDQSFRMQFNTVENNTQMEFMAGCSNADFSVPTTMQAASEVIASLTKSSTHLTSTLMHELGRNEHANLTENETVQTGFAASMPSGEDFSAKKPKSSRRIQKMNTKKRRISKRKCKKNDKNSKKYLSVDIKMANSVPSVQNVNGEDYEKVTYSINTVSRITEEDGHVHDFELASSGVKRASRSKFRLRIRSKSCRKLHFMKENGEVDCDCFGNSNVDTSSVSAFEEESPIRTRYTRRKKSKSDSNRTQKRITRNVLHVDSPAVEDTSMDVDVQDSHIDSVTETEAPVKQDGSTECSSEKFNRKDEIVEPDRRLKNVLNEVRETTMEQSKESEVANEITREDSGFHDSLVPTSANGTLRPESQNDTIAETTLSSTSTRQIDTVSEFRDMHQRPADQKQTLQQASGSNSIASGKVMLPIAFPDGIVGNFYLQSSDSLGTSNILGPRSNLLILGCPRPENNTSCSTFVRQIPVVLWDVEQNPIAVVSPSTKQPARCPKIETRSRGAKTTAVQVQRKVRVTWRSKSSRGRRGRPPLSSAERLARSTPRTLRVSAGET